MMLDERDAYASKLRIKTIMGEDPHSNIYPSIHRIELKRPARLCKGFKAIDASIIDASAATWQTI